MDGFFTALSQHAFLQTAVATALLASIGCGVMGTYVVVKRIAFIAGGIAHSVLGGMGAAVYFGFEPLHGALPAAIAAGSAPCSGSKPKYTAAPIPPRTEWAMPPAMKAIRLTTT